MKIHGKTVIVGMSGGVDSSVSALLLKNLGYEVIALFMKNWEELSGDCSASYDYADVVRVCEKIKIPYYTINFVKEYWDNVFSHFLKELSLGFTPNPDVLCNREIKFKLFLNKAMELGGDYLATGHYAQNTNNSLLKSVDQEKDQTYFLHTLNQTILKKVIFPIGHLKKSSVRSLAKQYGLPTATKKDSTGICFIGKKKFTTFLQQYICYQKGRFETLSGKIVGDHNGIAFYTIGQRKGLNIGGKGDAWFVVGKDTSRNVVYVEQGQDHPALYQSTVIGTETSWISHPPITPFSCCAKIRYRQADQKCLITKIENGTVFVSFDQPQRAITPRQSIVFYKNNVCLGGAFIS
jgi:tRNA-uridine 2-sulfurtransferase